MLFLPLIFRFVMSICNINVSDEHGVHHHRYEVTETEEVCINITNYPFFIIFPSNLGESVIYHEYYSRNNSNFYSNYTKIVGTNLPFYRSIEVPYCSMTFSSTDTDKIYFTTVILPGNCDLSLYFSSKTRDSVMLSEDFEDFYEIKSYDDKCLIYVTPGLKTFKVKQSSVSEANRVLFYDSDGSIEDVGFGDFTKDWSDGNESFSPFLRVLTSDDDPPTSVIVDVSVDETEAYGDMSAYHVIRGRSAECTSYNVTFSENIVILLIASNILSVVCLLAFLVQWIRKRKIKKDV